MSTLYMIGYSGKTVTRAELLAWPQFQKLDDETARRTLALIDASHTAGRPVGIGGTFRTNEQQTSLFLTRHHLVTTGGCCTYNGHNYQLNSGQAHAAPPGRSYHEATTAKGECYAIDFIGDMTWLDANVAKYGLVWIQPEPWHVQPAEIPHSRSGYSQALYEPLKPFPLPVPPTPTPKKIYAPKPALKVGAPNNTTQARAFQLMCNFWGWKDAYGKVLLVDGIYSSKSAQACMNMQRSFKIGVDGVYGPVTATKLQAFLDVMVGLKP